ncbi:MAG: Holliday junction branch migration protein RuvA [Ruminococcaceae bacterium]|nr:Holliday junction branch migration protein RuvA [Oscillospiraceae bacterium]
MFSYISGKLVEKNKDYAVIDVSGVGFKIYTSLTSLSDQSLQKGDNVTFHTYLYIKEGIMDLYGFSTKEELSLFELLISVSGVGAKGAVSILSVATPSKLSLSIVSDDVATIKKASGIGAKTAQRICLELKDKIKNEDIISKDTDAFVSVSDVTSDSARQDAVSALIVLGYSNQEAQRAVGSVRETFDDAESYIKHALKNLL